MKFMKTAISEAKKAYKEGNVPVGCVLVRNGKIIAKAHNLKNTKNISIYHAEMLALIKACKKLRKWYLDDCELYVTLKPCEMCLAAIAESRIKKVYYLLDSDYYTNLNKNIKKLKFEEVQDKYEYKTLLTNFFKKIRK